MKSENRRSFLKRAAMAAVVPALGTPAAGLSGWLTQSAGPHIKFAATPRERISVSTYPFREFIIGQHDEKSAGAKKMPLRDFPAHAVAKFKISKIEPWSEHFTSLEPAYLDELRNAAGKAGCGFANLAADGENSLYSPDSAERQRAIQFGKTWIDVAVRLGSPSVRLNLATAKNAKPDASLTSATAWATFPRKTPTAAWISCSRMLTAFRMSKTPPQLPRMLLSRWIWPAFSRWPRNTTTRVSFRWNGKPPAMFTREPPR